MNKIVFLKLKIVLTWFIGHLEVKFQRLKSHVFHRGPTPFHSKSTDRPAVVWWAKEALQRHPKANLKADRY